MISWFLAQPFMVRVTGLGGDAVCGGNAGVACVRLHQTSRGGKQLRILQESLGRKGAGGRRLGITRRLPSGRPRSATRQAC